MYSGVVTVILASLIIIGMALGMLRGFTKSWIRLIIVLASAVLSYFLAGAVGSAIASIDISGMGKVVNGQSVSTISALVEEYLKSIKIVGDLIEGSPTIGKVISILPLAIINLVLFDVLFLLINFFSWIIFMIIFGIVNKKHKGDEEKPKRKGLGVLFSVMQSIIVFAVLFVPVMGMTYFISDQIEYATNYNGELEQASVEGTASADEYCNEMIVFAEEVANSETTESNAEEEITEKVKVVTDSLEESWVFKVFKVFGYKKVTMALTDNLTQFEINEVETGLFNEVESVVKIGVRVDWLFGGNRQISSWTTNDVKILREVVGKFFDSPIFGDISYELVNTVATKWTDETANNTEFLGYAKPNTSSDVETILNELFKGLKTDNKDDLENEFYAIIDTVNCLIEKDVLKLVSKNVDVVTFMEPIKNDKVVADVLTNLTHGNALSRTIPSVIQLGLNQMYTAVGVPQEDYDRLKINVSSSQINWTNESVVLDDLFSNLAKVYESITKEGDIKDTLDYDSLAVALEKMRNSSLLSKSKVTVDGTDTTKALNHELTITLLKCSEMKDIDGMGAVIIDIDANYTEVNFHTLLNTLKCAVKISTDLKNLQVDSEDVAGLLNGLQDEIVGTIIKDAVEEKLNKEIDKLGGDNVSDTTAVNNMVNAVIDYNTEALRHNGEAENQLPTMPTEKEELNQTAESAKELFNVIKKGESAESSAETKYFESKIDLQNFIQEMHKSDYLWQMSLKNSATLGFKDESGKTTLTATEYAWAEALVNEKYGEEENQKSYYTQAEMENLFGTN